MKKNYKAPSCKVYSVEVRLLNGFSSTNFSGTQNVTWDPSSPATEFTSRRRSSLWDDDDADF